MGGGPCPTAACRVCLTAEEGETVCRSRNLVYSNVCLTCKEQGVDTMYIGETGRSVGERALEHWEDWKSRKEGSHITDHMKSYHEGEEPQMKLQTTKKCKTALQRQVSETINIKFQKTKGSIILNSKI